jgi:oxidase EvaA
VPYIDHFMGPRRGRVLVDMLQSEHGSWFLQKRNRNMVVEVTGDVVADDGFCWLTLGQLRSLLRRDNVVNMDTRSVLGCLPLHPPMPGGPAFRDALVRSTCAGEPARFDLSEVARWLTDVRATRDVRRRQLPLRQVDRWVREPDSIRHVDGRFFEVIAVDVTAGGREVRRWSQPMLAPRTTALVAFLAKRINGVLHLLVQARVEAGAACIAVLAPTVQCEPANYAGVAAPDRPAFLDRVLDADPAAVRLDVVQSEEGGRLYRAQTRNMVVEVGEDFPDAVPAAFCWMTVHQLGTLAKHPDYLNVEARGLLACVHTLW